MGVTAHVRHYTLSFLQNQSGLSIFRQGYAMFCVIMLPARTTRLNACSPDTLFAIGVDFFSGLSIIRNRGFPSRDAASSSFRIETAVVVSYGGLFLAFILPFTEPIR
jgi:hypothetical protein